jgi:excisionase family DNA binding protein
MATDDRLELLTAGEVAKLLRVKPSWVGDATRRGVLPALRFGRLVRYSRAEVEAWAMAQKRPLRPS